MTCPIPPRPPSRCPDGRDCRRRPNPRTGRCHFHDAMALVTDLESLAVSALEALVELDRQESADSEPEGSEP